MGAHVLAGLSDAVLVRRVGRRWRATGLRGEGQAAQSRRQGRLCRLSANGPRWRVPGAVSLMEGWGSPVWNLPRRETTST